MRSLSLGVLAIAALFTTACGDDDPTGPGAAGRIRAVHAISNVANVDVLLGTTSYKTNLAYKSQDGFRDVTPGTIAVKFRKAGVATDLVSAATTVTSLGDRTVIALGTEAAPQTLVLVDDNSAPAAGKVKLRVVHAAEGANAVDVYVLANANELANATPVKTNLASKTASDYIVRDAGTFVVILTTVGTKTPVLTVGDVQVAAGKIRTILAVEKAGGGAPLEAVTLVDN